MTAHLPLASVPLPVAAPGVRVEIVTDDRALPACEPSWERLLAVTPLASGFQSFAWIAACRAALPGGRARLFTVVVRDGSELIGILPAEIAGGGRLRLIGDTVGNYGGPVYRPDRVDDVVAGITAGLDSTPDVLLFDLRGLRGGSPFLSALRAASLPGWHRGRVVQTSTCPLVDLTGGPDSVHARRKGKQRATDARKWRALERLGRLEFVETEDPETIRSALPAMFRLFQSRWAGRHESSGFATRRRAFHEKAALALAGVGLARLALLTLDGAIIAFSYGVRAGRVTSSYVLAHDDRFAVCSPGLLLLIRVLASAAERDDPEYDFSIGEETYKDAWATGNRAVFRVLRWRERSWAAVTGRMYDAGSRAWATARGIGWLRDLRREGLRRRAAGATMADAPGLSLGPPRPWRVYCVRDRRALGVAHAVRAATLSDMRGQLSPRLCQVAVERSYRGDTLLLVSTDDRLVGVVWRAGERRTATARAGRDAAACGVVYYDPIAAAGHAVDDLVAALASLDEGTPARIVVARQRLAGEEVEHIGMLGMPGESSSLLATLGEVLAHLARR